MESTTWSAQWSARGGCKLPSHRPPIKVLVDWGFFCKFALYITNQA